MSVFFILNILALYYLQVLYYPFCASLFNGDIWYEKNVEKSPKLTEDDDDDDERVKAEDSSFLWRRSPRR